MPNRKRRGRGEGGVRFDEARGLWVASVSLGYHPDGRRNRPVAYGKTKTEALAALDRMRKDNAAPVEGGGRLTVGELLDLWLAARKGHVAEHTHEGRVAASARVKAAIGGLVASRLTPLRVTQLHAGLRAAGASPSACWHAARALSGCLEHAVRLQALASNPARAAGLPALVAREMIVLSPAQARALLAAAAGYVAGPLVAVALGTGLRQGEQLGLVPADVDLGVPSLSVRRQLTRTKTSGFALRKVKTKAARRTVALPAFAAEALAQVLEGRAGGDAARTVFCGPRGGHRHRGQLSHHLKKAIARANRLGAGIPPEFNWHAMRHTHASLLISAGHSIRAVSARLGHSSPAFTLSRYGHLMPGDDERLARGVEEIIGSSVVTQTF